MFTPSVSKGTGWIGGADTEMLLGLSYWSSQGNVQEAKRRIVHCFDNSTTNLDLSGLGLSTLPDGIQYLKHLRGLNLKDNKMDSLPHSMGNLKQLEVLNLENNGIRSLSSCVADLSQLQELNLKNNKIDSLPYQIGQSGNLKRLRTLNLENNKFASLPREIKGLPCGARLIFAENDITMIPSEFGDLNIDVSRQRGGRIALPPPSLSGPASSNRPQLSPPVSGPASSNRPQLSPPVSGPAPSNRLQQFGQPVVSDADFQRMLNTGVFGNPNPPSGQPLYTGALGNPNPPSGQAPYPNLFRQNLFEQARRELERAGGFSNRVENPRVNIFRPTDAFGRFKEAAPQERQDLKQLEISKLREAEELWPTISVWLGKLESSNDFRTMNTRAVTAERVLLVLKLAEENPKYRKFFYIVLHGASESCTDRATLPLCALEIQKAVIEAQAGSVDQMLKVLKGAFAAELLDGCAGEFMNMYGRSRGSDEIEVYLGFQVKLKAEFNLPIGVRNMGYFTYSKLQESDFAAARIKVHQGLQNQEKFIDFLVRQKTWVKKLEKDFASEKEAYVNPIKGELWQLEGRMTAGLVNSQQYDEQTRAISARLKIAEKNWLRAKTGQIGFNVAPQIPAMATVITIKCKDLPSNQKLFIRGNNAGLNWNQGVELTARDWETFEFRTPVPFAGELQYKLLLNDDNKKWEVGIPGNNYKITQGKTVERVHSFDKALLPPLKKTVLTLDFPVPQGQTLCLSGTGPLGNWDKQVPMRPAGDGSWFMSFDGEFPDFEYKIRLNGRWEQIERNGNRTAKCGKGSALKAPRF